MAINNIMWKGVRLRIQSYNVLVGDAQLDLKRCFRDSEGTPVLMLPGFLENCDVFLGRHHDTGLAPFLATQGYDVYLLELRGKGNSWPNTGRKSRWGLHQAICEDIPAHLRMIEKLRPGVPQFWLGHGLGSLLLTAAYARLDSLSTPLLGMIHISAGRLCNLEEWRKTLRYQSWLIGLRLQQFVRGFVQIPLSKSPRCETAASFKSYLEWQRQVQWLDPDDGYDYGHAVRRTVLPPSLYLANHQRNLWGNSRDCRMWIQELGLHDCRLINVSRAGGNDRDYSFGSILQDHGACEDHFQQILEWLNEHNHTEVEDDVSQLMEA